MLGTKYLSELVKPDMLAKDKLNIIKAPTGSGKTYFALTAIPAMLHDALHKVVYLIDTINGKEQLLRNYNARPIYRGWAGEISEGGIFFVGDERIVIITYAKFGCLLQRNPDFHTHFDYIICDELHSLVSFMGFSPQPNLHSVAKSGLEQAVRNKRSTVIALTATPRRVHQRFNAPYWDVPIDDSELIHYETRHVIRYTSLDYLLTTLDTASTGLCYIPRITAMRSVEEHARSLGFRPICIWSINNPNHPMSEEQLAVRQTILDDFAIPEEYNLVIINASSETSLKIKSPVDYVIVHSGDEDTEIQVRGRVNSDLDYLYLPINSDTTSIVPAEFLNRKLFDTDKDRLCDYLDFRNENGRQFRWRGVRPRLEQRGYIITDGRDGSRRYVIITEPEE